MNYRLAIALIALTSSFQSSIGAQTARFERFSYDGRTPDEKAISAGEYRNPVVSGYYPDPSVTRADEDYYLVNSSFAHYPGLPIFKSRDLVNWVQIGNAIDRPTQLDFTGRKISEAAFAPDISYHDGIFYIVNTCVGCKGNFVITAKDPAGPWSDPIWLPFEGIDPSIFWEGDRAYIVNNRAPDEAPRYNGHRAIWIQEFDWRAGKMVGESRQIVNGGVDITQKPVWIEGPHIFRKDGRYYLIAAEGGTGPNHSEVVFRSDQLWGPYIPLKTNPILTQRNLPSDRPNPISAAGHAKFVETGKGDWWAVFLGVRPYADDKYTIGRETFLAPVSWQDGWPHILDQGQVVPSVARRPRLPSNPPSNPPTSGSFSYVDAFDGDYLDLQWIGIRTPKRPFYNVAQDGLEMRAGSRLGDLSQAPSFIGRRLQHHVATISTTMHFMPLKDGDQAGLAAVQSDQSNLFFGVTRIAGKPAVALYMRDREAEETPIATAPVDPRREVTLTIRTDNGKWSFDYSNGGRKRTLKSGLDVTFLTTERAGGFVGTVVGLYTAKPR
ncbi:glycoside hydrolase family 43 protein [Sphingobium sp. YR768]|uniref:glycoside hydrolase family 43 protein n=1 Tax=Sphingobium sp. YR768 TaxID=1884365 RepID=UPI0008AF343B|nr:glycoside hydrolase family 43 protein [Sphingobium sp. YR768]SER31264.1 alpha-N-arabinofuranosidase [Sphingobium sp. YR768]